MSKKKHNGASPPDAVPNILVMGPTGSGKKTLAASICHYINTGNDFLLRYGAKDKDNVGLLRSLLSITEYKNFLTGEKWLVTNSVRIGLESAGDGETRNLSFTILSHNASVSFLSANRYDAAAYNDFSKSIGQADIIVCVLSSDNAQDTDKELPILFDLVLSGDRTIPLFFVVSKWDKVDPAFKDARHFIRAQMPVTYKWIESGKLPHARAFPFSVGQVNDKDTILRLNTQYAAKIFWAIYDYLYGPVSSPTSLQDSRLKDLLARLNNEPDNIELLREIETTYASVGEKDEAQAVAQKRHALEDKQKSRQNLGKRILLQKAELHDLDFFADLHWPLAPGINVLLGRNGYGKTYLMRLLVALLQKNDDKSSEFFKTDKPDPFARLSLQKEDDPDTVYRNRLVFEESPGTIPVLAIPDMRGLDKSHPFVGFPEFPDNMEKDPTQRWAYYFLYEKPVYGLIQEFLYQLCIDYLDKKSFDLPIFKLIEKAVQKLTNLEFAFREIKSVGHARFEVYVITEGNPAPIPIQKASQGTLSILAILGLIYSYLQSVFPGVDPDELTDKPALVFIDEIDAHLHPSWQQKIVSLLQETFPNIQFVVTAHSPLVVAGCKAGEVAVLKKDDKGFSLKPLEQDFIGHLAGELYEQVFEIEETDHAYLHYNALYPFRGEIQNEIEQLKKERAQNGGTFTKEKEKKLKRLYDDLYYAEKAYKRFEKRRDISRALRENRRLKAEIKKLRQGA